MAKIHLNPPGVGGNDMTLNLNVIAKTLQLKHTSSCLYVLLIIDIIVRGGGWYSVLHPSGYIYAVSCRIPMNPVFILT